MKFLVGAEVHRWTHWLIRLTLVYLLARLERWLILMMLVINSSKASKCMRTRVLCLGSTIYHNLIRTELMRNFSNGPTEFNDSMGRLNRLYGGELALSCRDRIIFLANPSALLSKSLLPLGSLNVEMVN